MKLTEASAWEAGVIENGVIKDVKILGEVSRNKFVYPASTRQAACSIIENAKVNLNHNKKNVGLESRFGKLVNVRDTEGGLRGDLHYLTKHPYAAAIAEAATTMPEILGLSILGEGKGSEKDKDGNTIIESIEKIFSVDLVANAATNNSLFEAEAEDGPAADPKAAHWEGVLNAVTAHLHDDKLDNGGKASAIKKLLDGHDKLYKEEDKTEEKEDNAAAESVKVTRTEADVRAICETVGVTASPTLLQAMLYVPDAEAYAKEVKQASLIKKPKSLVPIEEAKLDKDFVKIIRGIK